MGIDVRFLGFSICDSNGKLILQMNRTNTAQNAKQHFISDYYDDLNGTSIKLEWYNFLPIVKDPELSQHPIVDITEGLREKIIISFKYLSNIGPVRAIPERNQPFTGENPIN